MNQIKTFLAVTANGSFLEAATRLHVTHSTVSSRIQSLETYLARVFSYATALAQRLPLQVGVSSITQKTFY